MRAMTETKENNKSCWMMALGQVGPEPSLYAQKRARPDPFKPLDYGAVLSLEARKQIRTEIKKRLEINVNRQATDIYRELLQLELLPKRVDGRTLTQQAFFEYVKYCRKDMRAGITDDQVIELYLSGKSIKTISIELKLTMHNIRDRLCCSGVIEEIISQLEK